MAGGISAVWQVKPCARFPAGLTGFHFDIPPDHLQVTGKVRTKEQIKP